eukprot:TRINITY_DN37804_c0_g1_i1.p1 TRINITY_DN37804_c0_g1~~TRINITY_DN37804_c0_g1_i1.p1  ORF type:complete len:267 (+),score=37.74 TRINITY_DN37804_c0_g1_i1:139-939(+)
MTNYQKWDKWAADYGSDSDDDGSKEPGAIHVDPSLRQRIKEVEKLVEDKKGKGKATGSSSRKDAARGTVGFNSSHVNKQVKEEEDLITDPNDPRLPVIAEYCRLTQMEDIEKFLKHNPSIISQTVSNHIFHTACSLKTPDQIVNHLIRLSQILNFLLSLGSRGGDIFFAALKDKNSDRGRVVFQSQVEDLHVRVRRLRRQKRGELPGSAGDEEDATARLNKDIKQMDIAKGPGAKPFAWSYVKWGILGLGGVSLAFLAYLYLALFY